MARRPFRIEREYAPGTRREVFFSSKEDLCHAVTKTNTRTNRRGRRNTSLKAMSLAACRRMKPNAEHGRPKTRFITAARNMVAAVTASLRTTSRCGAEDTKAVRG